jgi:hypothetical protein
MKKDSLIIDGKTYISSRRASEIAVYSKDYVGQLCREGKLVCRRVNRLWWVDESSIRKHAAETVKSNHTSFRSIDDSALVRNISSQPSPIQSARSVQSSSIAQSSQIDPLTKPTDPVITEKTATGIPMYMAKRSIENSFENLVGVETANKNVFSSEAIGASKDRMASGNETDDGSKNNYQNLHAIFPRRIFTIGSVFALVLALGTIVSMIYFLNGSRSISIGSSSHEVAAVNDSSSKSFLGFLWSSVAGVFSERSPSILSVSSNSLSDVTNVEPTESAADLSEPHAGLVVVPSQGSSTNAKLVQAVTNSFSDNVTVTPGTNGTTGVITPEFRNAQGHDFLYMLVPVKTASTTNN